MQEKGGVHVQHCMSIEVGCTGDVGSGVEAVGGQIAAVQVGRVDNLFEGRAGQVCLVGGQPLVQLPARIRHCTVTPGTHPSTALMQRQPLLSFSVTIPTQPCWRVTPSGC